MKLYAMEIGSFPAELLQLIALRLSTFDYQQLARTNKHIRRILGRFSYAFLVSILHELTFNVELLVSIEQTDSFLFALDSTDRLVILHQKLDIGEVYLLIFHPSGRLETKRQTTNARCYMDASKCRCKKCPFCTRFKISRILYRIDKEYPVFFVSWSDDVSFKTARNVNVHVRLRHVPESYYMKGVGMSEVQRYGLLLTEADIEWGESIVSKFGPRF
jgi:hypothetical protein